MSPGRWFRLMLLICVVAPCMVLAFCVFAIGINALEPLPNPVTVVLSVFALVGGVSLMAHLIWEGKD